MTRKEFIKFIQTGKLDKPKKQLISGKSLTDPTFARTGRQMIFQPLPIEYRMKYPDGTPLNPDNPYDFKEYDKLYPDTFKASREAHSDISKTKKHLDSAKKQYEASKQNIESNKPTT